MNKFYRAGAVALAMATLVTGCSSGGSDTAEAEVPTNEDGQRILAFDAFEGGNGTEFLEEAAAAFEEANPDVDVQIRWSKDIDQEMQKDNTNFIRRREHAARIYGQRCFACQPFRCGRRQPGERIRRSAVRDRGGHSRSRMRFGVQGIRFHAAHGGGRALFAALYAFFARHARFLCRCGRKYAGSPVRYFRLLCSLGAKAYILRLRIF